MADKMTLIIKALSKNEAFARSTVAAFVTPLNPTVDEISDIKTAVSEAVTNCIVHAYEHDGNKDVVIECELKRNSVHIRVSDEGVGIDNIEVAMQPFWTSRPQDERSGMGFTIMEGFMNELVVQNNAHGGLTVDMTKIIGRD